MTILNRFQNENSIWKIKINRLKKKKSQWSSEWMLYGFRPGYITKKYQKIYKDWKIPCTAWDEGM